MICTEDEKFYPAGTTWNLYGCTVELLEVLYDGERTIVCDVTVDGQTHYEEMLQHGTTHTYGAYTVTCRGFFGTDEPLAQTIICTESEPTDVLTLYFRPWPWTNLDGVATDAVNKTVEIQGAIVNALSDYTGYEYVSHEITKVTMEGRTRKYIAVHIYINDTSSALNVQIAPAVAIEIGIAIVLVVAVLGLIVGWKWGTAASSETIIILEQELAETKKKLNDLQAQVDGDAFVGGEISGEEYIEIMYEAIRENKETANLLHLDPATFNGYELCMNTAIDAYQSSEKTQADKTFFRESRDMCESGFGLLMTDEVNSREPAPFLPDFDDLMDDLLKYAKYGLLALFGIMAVKAAID